MGENVFRWVISVRVGIWAPVGPVTRARGLRKIFARGATRARIGRVRGCPRAESRALGLGYTQRGREARGSGCEGVATKCAIMASIWLHVATYQNVAGLARQSRDRAGPRVPAGGIESPGPGLHAVGSGGTGVGV